VYGNRPVPPPEKKGGERTDREPPGPHLGRLLIGLGGVDPFGPRAGSRTVRRRKETEERGPSRRASKGGSATERFVKPITHPGGVSTKATAGGGIRCPQS
jgi:hypothetical protein